MKAVCGGFGRVKTRPKLIRHGRVIRSLAKQAYCMRATAVATCYITSGTVVRQTQFDNYNNHANHNNQTKRHASGGLINSCFLKLVATLHANEPCKQANGKGLAVGELACQRENREARGGQLCLCGWNFLGESPIDWARQ